MNTSPILAIGVLALAFAGPRPASAAPHSAAGPPPAATADASAAARTEGKAKNGEDALKEALVDLEKQSWEAWKTRNGGFFQEFLSDDHVEVGVWGVSNKTRVVAGVASPDCVVTSYKIGNFELTSFDANVALLVYRAEQDTICNGKAVPSPVWASSLYVRRGDRWRNALYQHTPAATK
jgi:hypothetical protein